jgi:hypothetical protein
MIPPSAVDSAPPVQLDSASDGFVDRPDGRFYRIADVDRMPTFFMSVLSPTDVWLFIASNGGLSAGRGNADHAYFPYQTVDRIYDSAGHTGGCCALWVEGDDGPVLWEPFSLHGARVHRIRRHLYKSLEGDRVWFEELHPALGLVYRVGWTATAAHGLVRSTEIGNTGVAARRIRVLDGVRNIMVPGVSRRLQNEFSCLTDAYKQSEQLPGCTLGVFTLAAAIVDRAIPMESLLATTVWSEGWPEAAVVLAPDACEAFAQGRALTTGLDVRGARAAYALTGELDLAPGEAQSWRLAIDTDRTQAQVSERATALRGGGAPAELDAALADSRLQLRALVGAADGIQSGGDEVATAHHFANTLFNVMRGGVFAFGSDVDGPDFADFVRARNRDAARRHSTLLAALPARLPRRELLERAVATGDVDLERLAREHLPLTFSRRHGDPSRPWNRFNIRVSDRTGARVLDHEGNWRDIFQNWESLCLAFPEFCESVIARFLNASTADGYNPYRISRAGIDWEAPEPEDPWASIGYWGDHQTIYLLRLLEWSGRFHPGELAGLMRREIFSHADVPYRIVGYDRLRANPRSTIVFDAAAHEHTVKREREAGADARLLTGPDGRVLHANLTEKLLLLALVRISNLVPEGGIWMNTQRPEWNDANNALVGNGLSVVTLAYLRRFLAHVQAELLPALGARPVRLSAGVVLFLRELDQTVQSHAGEVRAARWTDASRRAFVDAAGEAGARHRARLYESGPGLPEGIEPAAITSFITRALALVDQSLRANRRPDGLWHAYNLLRFSEGPASLAVSHLAPMLEGQVAVLSAGLLQPAEVVALLKAMRASPLYRADQHSYLLYPDRTTPGFLARNAIPEHVVAGSPLLADLLRSGDTRLVLRDADGVARFNPDLVNGDALEQRLASTGVNPRLCDVLQTCYENVFRHREFTGRSSSMFGYEGLGCIYWHMVAKLLVAVQENQVAAERANDPAAVPLAGFYRDIRDGLGYRKSARVYGAFPTDPYSHTPGQAGAQQPGMTGQVKEELITRLLELGVRHESGTIRFDPARVEATEFTPAGELAFTLCGVPVTYRRKTAHGTSTLRAHGPDGATCIFEHLILPQTESAALMARGGAISHLEIEFSAH